MSLIKKKGIEKMIKQMLKIFGIAVVVVSVAHAGALKDAIRDGKVCEKQDGFVQAIPGNESETAQLVTDVNVKRQKLYSRIAEDRSVSPTIVAQESATERRAKNPERFCKNQPAPCR
jgi:uncharacterized protein YdbL (DUF1318 family)